MGGGLVEAGAGAWILADIRLGQGKANSHARGSVRVQPPSVVASPRPSSRRVSSSR
jgi:hypothetical protein